ncbi:MAG: hypothetical protein ACE5PV_18595, partial [Candidatus Poribacteria bacterium]
IDLNDATLLDRLAGKILHECTQFPDSAKNVLIIKTEDLYVTPDDVINVFMEESLVFHKDERKPTTKYRHHFRTEDELNEVLEKISAIIAYHDICLHEKLIGVFANNSVNAKVPLEDKDRSSLDGMVCKDDNCYPTIT